jgi:hypothetical protein
MTLNTYLTLFFFETILSATIAVLAFYRFRKRQKLIRLVGLLFLTGFLCNCLAYFFAAYQFKRLINIPGSVYEFALIIIISALFNQAVGSRYKTVFKVIAIVYIAVALTNLLYIQKEAITSYNKMLSSAIIIGYAITYFYRLIIDLPSKNVYQLPMFWFSSAFLIYNAGTIFLFAFTSYLVHVLNNDMIAFMSFHNCLSIISQLIIIVGVTYDLRTMSNPVLSNIK